MCSQVPCTLSPPLVKSYGYRSQGNSTIYPNWDRQDDKMRAEACRASGEARAAVGVVRTGGTVRRGFNHQSLPSADPRAQHRMGVLMMERDGYLLF